MSSGLDVLQPPPGQTDRDRIRTGMLLMLDIQVAAVERAPGASEEAAEAMRTLRALTIALVDEDMVTATQQVTSLVRQAMVQAAENTGDPQTREHIESVGSALTRVSPIITAITTNARLLEEAGANPDQAQALREARKRTLEALIDANTDRRGLGGYSVVSIGIPVGFRGTMSPTGRYPIDDFFGFGQAMALPLGLYYQRLP
ncbi:MAG: hypothetical protein GY773_24170, partial [Actinomycetia bacterium]|nr:hypothetical protein [Actinomycetes bacterium]